MDIKLVAKKIKESGGRLYYVGGYVRDKIMEKDAKDIDFCITGITPEIFLELFPKAFSKGSFFPVFQLENYEFAFARKEIKVEPGHKGFSFDIKNISIIDDLIRRDITINSMAIDVLTEELIDPFNGQKDIKEKIIRATANHFTEDPLRVYRVSPQPQSPEPCRSFHLPWPLPIPLPPGGPAPGPPQDPYFRRPCR